MSNVHAATCTMCSMFVFFFNIECSPGIINYYYDNGRSLEVCVCGGGGGGGSEGCVRGVPLQPSQLGLGECSPEANAFCI